MNRHQHSCIHEQSNLCIDILSCKTSIGSKSQQLSRASILNQLYLFLFLDLAPPLENSNQPSSETLENEVYVGRGPSQPITISAQTAQINQRFSHKPGSEANMPGSKRPNSEFWRQKNHRPGQKKKPKKNPSRDHGESHPRAPSQNVAFCQNSVQVPLG